MAGDFLGFPNGHISALSFEPMESEVTVESLEAIEGSLDLSASHVLSCNSFKGSDSIVNEPALYEKFILEDLDNYWDEINDRLTVSRMVSDSVIKGMVRAVAEESAEEIALKEAQIGNLKERLQLYVSKAASGSDFLKLPANQCHCYLQPTRDAENLYHIKIAIEEQVLMLKNEFQNVKVSTYQGIRSSNFHTEDKTGEHLTGIDTKADAVREVVAAAFEEIKEMFYSMKASAIEEQWQFESQREINAIIVENRMKDLQDEFERKLYEQRELVRVLNMSWQQKVTELSTMREELENISKSFQPSESGLLISHKSHESLEESHSGNFSRTMSESAQFPYTAHSEENGSGSIKKAKDISQPMLDVVDASQLSRLSKEEIITYYKTEVLKMRRHHELALQEKTEEIFRLKREFLKEKGSPLRKDKDFEMLKKKIPEVIGKLDNILSEEVVLLDVDNSYDELCSLKNNVGTLQSRIQHLEDLLAEEKEKVKCLSTQISDVTNQMSIYSSTELTYLARIATLQSQIQHFVNLLAVEKEKVKCLSVQISDLTSQVSIHSSTDISYLAQIDKLSGDLEDMKIEASIRIDVLTVVFKELLAEYICNQEDIEVEAKFMQELYTTAVRGIVDDAMSSRDSESSLTSLLSEKQKLLSEEVEENRKLRETVMSLATTLKEKESFALDSDSMLKQYRERFNLLDEELKMLREEVTKHQNLIAEHVKDSELLKRRLDESLLQNRYNEVEIKKLNGELVVATNALDDAEKQNIALHNIIEENEKNRISSSTTENFGAEDMRSIVVSMVELSGALLALESNLTEKVERFEARVQGVSHEFSPLLQQTQQLIKKEEWYKKMLDIRYSNLQKAEAEVDLLGDEVDALLSLLGKVYIALDHYSPVLQLYPGVMEILKLVRRELEGGATRAS